MINLKKGEGINLSKSAGTALTSVMVGAGWDPVKKKGFLGFGGGSNDIDLDASCGIFAGGQLIDQVWFQQKESRDGAIRHSGDNLTGQGDGDDETINVDLSRLNPSADGLVFTINSFRGQTFNEVENAYIRVVNNSTGQELGRYSLSESGSHTGMVVASLKKRADGWHFTAVGERTNGRTIRDMSAQMANAL